MKQNNLTIIIQKYNSKFVFSEYTNGDFDDKYFVDNKLDIIGNLVNILSDDKYSVKNKNIFIIDQPTISFNDRRVIAEVLFGVLNVSGLYIASQSMLSLYDNDLSSGIIIDIYDNKIYNIPIHNEHILKSKIEEVVIEKNDYPSVIKKKITNKINKLLHDCDVKITENIVLSTNLDKPIMDTFDDFNANYILGDPISGAKKIIPILDSYNGWITREKYKEIGANIIDKNCYN